MRIIPVAVCILVASIFVVSMHGSAFGIGEYDAWEHRKKITISLNTVISGDLSNFPVLVAVTDSDFTKASDSEGRDIFFTADDGTTLLSYEIERFNSSTGEIIAWVDIPTLPAASTTDIYIYYNGPTTSTPSNMWDSGYKLVYHLNQSSTGTVDEFVDASGTGNHGTGGGEGEKTQDADRRPTRAEGKIGYGQSFDGPVERNSKLEGTGDFIWTDSVNSWPGNNGGTTDNDTTVEFWINVDSNHDDVDMMDVYGYRAGGQHNEFTLFKVESINLFVRGSILLDSTVDAATSDWTHLMIVYNPGGTSKIYQDGTLAAEVDGTSGNRGQRADGNFVLGAEIDSTTRVNNELVGDMDEFRISNGVRSADWAKATYETQNTPSTYLSFGIEESDIISSDDKRNLNPYLTDEILVSVGPNKAIVTDTDYLPNIQIQKGDSIIITLNVADEGPVLDTNTFFGRSDIESVSLYTNFGPRPNGMNLYYANHFNSDGEVSKTFYEWNANKDLSLIHI